MQLQDPSTYSQRDGASSRQWRLLAGRRRRLGMLAICLLVAVLAPTPASAHVKWFEEAAGHPLRTELILSDRTLLWLASSAAAVLGLYAIHRLVARRRWPWTRVVRQMAAGAPTILAIQAAIALMSNAVHPSLLAPNLALPASAIGCGLALVQVLLALSLITGVGDWLAGLALIGLLPVIALLFSPADALEQVFWAGIGLVVLVIGRGAASTTLARPWFERRNPAWAGRAITILRVATGMSLVVVALTEKLWDPDLGRAFLLGRPELNVLQTLPGLGWFSNDLFVLAAGLAEAALGAMLISGFSPRLVILAMWLPFNLGIPVLPSQELLGHLPILGIMYLLLVQAEDLAPAREPAHIAPTWASGRLHAGKQRGRFRPSVSHRLAEVPGHRSPIQAGEPAGRVPVVSSH
jgi:hypothetical protein